MLNQVCKLNQALSQRSIPPLDASAQQKVRIRKYIRIQQAGALGTKEPLILTQQRRQRRETRARVLEYLLRVDAAVCAARRFQNLGRCCGVEGVAGGGTQERRGREVEGCEDGVVGWVEVEGL